MKQTDDLPVIILSTASPDNAKIIAKSLVGAKIAACVNMMAISSYYNWKGEFCDDNETLLIIKTMDSKKDLVMDAVRRLHTYELPEMIVVPVTGGFPPYLAWLREEVVP
jgi:periplasmic divalent cation tolerance protein